MPTLMNYPFALEMVARDTGLPRTGLSLSIVEIDGIIGTIDLAESGEGWYYSETVPKGTYKLYDSTSGTPVFTGVFCDHMASILREENGETETIVRRLFEQYKIPQSFGTDGYNMRSEHIQKAIDEAVVANDNKGVKRVVLPPGIYYMDAEVALLDADFELDGCGAAKLVYPDNTVVGYSMISMHSARQVVRGIVFDGSNMPATGVSDKGLLTIENGSCSQARVNGCIFRSATGALGIKLEAGQDAVLVANQFRDLAAAIRINSNTFGRAAIAGCGAYSCGAAPIVKIGSGALVYEAAGNYGIPAYIENIGTVTGGSISNVVFNNANIIDAELHTVYLGCRLNPDTGLVVKSADSKSAFKIERFLYEASHESLKISCADTSGLTNGQQVLFPAFQFVSIDEVGNVELSARNIGGVNEIFATAIEADEITATSLIGALSSADAVGNVNIKDNAVTNDKVVSVDWSKITNVPSDPTLKTSCAEAFQDTGDPVDYNTGLSVAKTILAVHDQIVVVDPSLANKVVGFQNKKLTATNTGGFWHVSLDADVVIVGQDAFHAVTVFYYD